MNYRHIYHAGNCADVVKHSILVLLLESLLKKDKGFCYVDTHAGKGIYDLHSIEANKTEEYKIGIERVIPAFQSPRLLQYGSIIKTLNRGESLHFYPGSPWIAEALKRPQDEMILNELHTSENEELRDLFSEEKQVSIHQRDAYEFLPAILPPKLRRGLVLIDPPFEKRDELEQIQKVLDKSFSKWPQGIYMVWLPLKENSLDDFYRHLRSYSCERKFRLELTWEAPIEKANALRGSAFVILNLPWQLEKSIEELMRELSRAWKSSHAKFSWAWL